MVPQTSITLSLIDFQKLTLAVDAQDFQPDDNRCFNEKEITIVAFTRLVYRKGIDLLAVILPDICERHPHVKFLICQALFPLLDDALVLDVLGGDGPKKKLLKELVSREALHSQVTLLPGVPHSQARSILVQGDIFVNASLTEAFCIAIVEAAAAGLLVVSTRVGGVPEVLPPDMLMLAEPTPDSLVEAIDEALTRVRHVNKREQHCRIAEMYSWQKVAERTETVYDAVRIVDRDDSLLSCLERYRKCGPFAGVIFVFLAMAMKILVWILEWWKPAGSIAVAPDLHPP